MITIDDVNDRPPEFAFPWTTTNPYYSIPFVSGQPNGSYVTTLIATEPNNNLIKYMIVNSTGGNFGIVPETGLQIHYSVCLF